jgi:hypothetical protein
MAGTVNGSCLCGAVRFAVELPTLFCAHCHCTMCRRSHGAGYITWIGVLREQFRVTGGEGRLVRYASSEHGTRSFCGKCGSSLLCESTQRPEEIDVVLANLDGEIDRKPEMHVFFSDRAAWVSVHDDLLKLGGPDGIQPLSESPDPPRRQRL